MNLHMKDEVIFAAHAALGEHCTLISRRSIEEQILKDRELYPLLHSLAQDHRRSLISRVMNAQYPVWSKTRGISQSSFVWIIREHPEGEE